MNDVKKCLKIKVKIGSGIVCLRLCSQYVAHCGVAVLIIFKGELQEFNHFVKRDGIL